MDFDFVDFLIVCLFLMGLYISITALKINNELVGIKERDVKADVLGLASKMEEIDQQVVELVSTISTVLAEVKTSREDLQKKMEEVLEEIKKAGAGAAPKRKPRAKPGPKPGSKRAPVIKGGRNKKDGTPGTPG